MDKYGRMMFGHQKTESVIVNWIYIVAYKPIVRQRPQNKQANSCCLVTAGKHINDIQVIARQLPIATIEKLLVAVFSDGSTPELYNEDPRTAEGN